MKRGWLKALFVLSFVFCAMFAFSISSSAATYEPDGTTSTQYEYDSSECNRTIVVSCVDESGNLIKKVNIKTKYGADDLCFVSIYNYDPIAFSSDQGLWETCKLMWTSGGMHCEGDIDIDYYFRTALSKKTINVTVVMRPFDQITIKEKHYKEQRIGTNGSIRNDILSDSKSTSLYCGDYFSTKAKSYTGYTLNSEYWSSLSGYWSMSMFGKQKNMGSVLSSMEWDIIDETWEMDGDDYPRWTEFDEDEDGILGHMENRVITIEYKYEVDWCTFTFNANGGTGAPSEKIEWWYDHAITIPSTVPTRTGYTFQGWGTSSTDTTPNYQPGQSTTMGTTKTLYAIWKANTYTVSFNANGGSGAPSSQTKTYGVTLTLSSTKPTRSGYTFKGWSTSSTATSATYSAGGSFTTNANTTLYAVWQKNAATTYTVSYNANGGSGAPASQTKTHNVTLTLSSTKPTRSGYTFKGWSTSSTATSATYSAGGSYTANASVTLYAVWSYNTPAPVATYTVSYNANGGSGAPASQTKTHNVTLTLSSTRPTRSGYSFLGWSTSSTATSPTYYASGSYTANASATLYAVWSKNAPTTYTISFNANGGSGAPSSVTKTNGVTLYLPSTIPTRTNYAFLGWSTSSTATTASYSAGGTFTLNANTTLYAVWEYDPATYRVYYNANGGSGAPSSQVKTYGVTLTLSSTVPTRSGYDFLGWSTSSTATSATYSAGGSYTANAGTTLYAVWEKANYEFSISNLTVSDSEPYRYGTITVQVRTDSWDRNNPYSDIPVQLYYDGQLMSTQYVDFAAYGVANLTFTLYVGDTPGNRSIEARINWSNRGSETNTGNNSITASISVQDFDYEMSIDDVTMTGNYCAGETVISSFTVSNDSDYDITPDKGNVAYFTAYYYNGSQKVVVATDTWSNVVIPSGKTNLVYFKWTVPANLAGKTVYCECTINYDDAVNEENRDNNTAAFSTTVSTFTDSQTPNTRYESSTPGSYRGNSAPANSTDKATWTMWVYENNQFVLKTYGVQISTASPVIEPSAECKTAVYANGKWTIRSGYGFTMSYSPTITTVSGYNNPGSAAYTSVQSVYATFPEFNYATTSGSYRTLEYVNGKWQLKQNSNAVDSERVHFIPVWFPDGYYTVSVTATRVWTPVGMIEATRTANTFTIDGSIYDDYFVGN